MTLRGKLTLHLLADDIAAGRYLESGADSGIVIGQKLARRLETGLGKRIVIMTQDPDNEIADRGFRIVGIFEAKIQAVEESFVFTGIDTAQRLLRIGDHVHEVAVTGADFRDIAPLRDRVADAAGPQERGPALV